MTRISRALLIAFTVVTTSCRADASRTDKDLRPRPQQNDLQPSKAHTARDPRCGRKIAANCPDTACLQALDQEAPNEVEPRTNRGFFLDYPCDLKANENVTFVLSLHGGWLSANWQRHYFPLVNIMDKYRMVIATPQSQARLWAAEDDAYLENIVDFVLQGFSQQQIGAFWLVGHSQGGQAANRLLNQGRLRKKLAVTGWVSLAGGRLGSKRAEVRRPIPGVVPPLLIAFAEILPKYEFSHIYVTGETELTDTGLPNHSRWATKLSCGPQRRMKDVIDERGGYVYSFSGNHQPNQIWGGLPGPGRAETFIYPGCRNGSMVADIVRMAKGHTEGVEPAVTEEIVKLMQSANRP